MQRWEKVKKKTSCCQQSVSKTPCHETPPSSWLLPSFSPEHGVNIVFIHEDTDRIHVWTRDVITGWSCVYILPHSVKTILSSRARRVKNLFPAHILVIVSWEKNPALKYTFQLVIKRHGSLARWKKYKKGNVYTRWTTKEISYFVHRGVIQLLRVRVPSNFLHLLPAREPFLLYSMIAHFRRDKSAPIASMRLHCIQGACLAQTRFEDYPHLQAIPRGYSRLSEVHSESFSSRRRHRMWPP